MDKDSKSQKYRDILDALVNMCHNGQGQIGAKRVRKGVWNINATLITAFLADQFEINQLLKRLSDNDREIIAKMLAGEVECGVFETLKVLEEYEISPFETGYEGSPYHDFIGRLSGDWEWPKQ